VSTALVYTVSYAFYSAQEYRGNTVLIAAALLSADEYLTDNADGTVSYFAKTGSMVLWFHV